MMDPIIPGPVEKGDPVAIVAPAGPPDKAAFEAGLARVERHFKPCFSGEILSRQGFLAGPDERRADELQAALDDPDVRAVLSARGGYGTTRILDRLDFTGLTRAPKWIVGSSDLTALLMHLWAWHRLVAIHGPMIARLETGDSREFEALADLLQGRPWTPPPDLLPLSEGSAQGPLIGGNLTILAHLCGPLPASCAQGAILFLEDVAEQPYRLDRCLVQLARAGFLERIAGAVLGRFTDCSPGPDGVTAEQVISERLRALGIPVAYNYPAAHGGANYPFVHGAQVRLEVGSTSVELGPI